MKRALPIFAALTVCLGGFNAFAAPPDDHIQVLVDDSVKDFEAQKFDDSIKKLQQADKEAPKSPFILNLLGAAFTKKKDYPQADNYFKQALEADSSFFPARYNVGEIFFLQKLYPQALSYFTTMLSEMPGNELLQFKVVLCLIQTGQVEEARKLAGGMLYPGTEPAWFYSQAAVALKDGKKREAADYLSSAKVMFESKVGLYNETFQDLGWPH